MPIVIEGKGTATKPVFHDHTLPSNTIVPSRRQAVEALELVCCRIGSGAGVPEALDILRRFILTR